MKNKIIIQNRKQLENLIREEINREGQECDLNHLDVSNIEDMSFLFYQSYFNGNISLWNVSHVVNMKSMFESSYFNGNIFDWNVEKVHDMSMMFKNSYFYGDISHWKPFQLQKMNNMFPSQTHKPYWYEIKSQSERNIMIEYYHLYFLLKQDPIMRAESFKKSKI